MAEQITEAEFRKKYGMPAQDLPQESGAALPAEEKPGFVKRMVDSMRRTDTGKKITDRQKALEGAGQ